MFDDRTTLTNDIQFNLFTYHIYSSIHLPPCIHISIIELLSTVRTDLSVYSREQPSLFTNQEKSYLHWSRALCVFSSVPRFRPPLAAGFPSSERGKLWELYGCLCHCSRKKRCYGWTGCQCWTLHPHLWQWGQRSCLVRSNPLLSLPATAMYWVVYNESSD